MFGIGLIFIVLLLLLKEFTLKNNNEKIYTYESEYIVQDIHNSNSTNFSLTLFDKTSNTSYPVTLSDEQISKYKTYKIGDVIVATMEIRTNTEGNIINHKLILP